MGQTPIRVQVLPETPDEAEIAVVRSNNYLPDK